MIAQSPPRPPAHSSCKTRRGMATVSRQSVSRYCILNARTRCVSIHFIFSKVSIVDLMDDGTFGYILSSFGFTVGLGAMKVLLRFGFSGRAT
jgi:hypothetical protein